MFPTVEPDLLHVLNNATAKQLRSLKECGQTRADSIVEFRESKGSYNTLTELSSRGALTAKVLLKVVYANAMDAEGLASLAHSVSPTNVDN